MLVALLNDHLISYTPAPDWDALRKGFCRFVRTHALHIFGTSLIYNDDREFLDLPE